MPAQRILIDLTSSDSAIARLERHSYVNLLNVIHAELQLVERMNDAPGSLRSAIHLSEAASRAFKEGRVAQRHLEELVRYASLIEGDLRDALSDAGEVDDEDVREAVAILLDVLPDAHLRVQEVVARHRVPRPVHETPAREFADRLRDVGVQVNVAAGRDVLHLAVGIEQSLAWLAAEGDGSAVQEVEVEGDESLRLLVSGRVPRGSFDPLVQNLRPSELHGMITSGRTVLRGMMLLSYCTVPHGCTSIDFGRSGSDRFTVVAEMPCDDFD